MVRVSRLRRGALGGLRSLEIGNGIGVTGLLGELVAAIVHIIVVVELRAAGLQPKHSKLETIRDC